MVRSTGCGLIRTKSSYAIEESLLITMNQSPNEQIPVPMEDAPDFKSDLSLMQTVYGILLVLGFRQIAEGLYAVVENKLPIDGLFLATSAFGIGLLFLGFRFFWAVGNIRRYVIRNHHLPGEFVRRRITTFLFPMLLMHAVAFYLLCRLHGDLINPALVESRTGQLAFLLCVFLLLNVIWLCIMIVPGLKRQPESIWILNNTSTAILILAAYSILSWYMFAPQYKLAVLSFLLIGNSMVDLWKTAKTYLAEYKIDIVPGRKIA